MWAGQVWVKTKDVKKKSLRLTMIESQLDRRVVEIIFQVDTAGKYGMYVPGPFKGVTISCLWGLCIYTLKLLSGLIHSGKVIWNLKGGPLKRSVACEQAFPGS